MPNTSITIRTDAEVKKKAQEIYAELGIDLSTALNVFLRQSIRYHGFPFAVRTLEPNEETLAAIHEAQEMKKNPLLGETYTDVDEMMEELLS